MNLTFSHFFFIFLFISIAYQQDCHYSCQTCVAPYYTYCLSCSNPSNTLTILEDPDKFQPEYRHSIYKSGICTGKVTTGTNGLGVFVLIITISALLLTQSFRAFFIISTLQTLALFSLLEVAWLGIGSFILQSFQYFMPINFIIGGLKNDDQRLFKYGFYRLDEYMISTQNIGLITLFVIQSILFIAIILIFIFTFLRKQSEKKSNRKRLQQRFLQNQPQPNVSQIIPQISTQSERFQQNNENPQQKIEQIQEVSNPTKKGLLLTILCEKLQQCFFLRKILHLLIYIFFFFVQETVLSIMIQAVFKINILNIIIWIVYFIQVVTVLIISFYELQVDKKLNPREKKTHQFGLSLFMSRECMFLVVFKKIVLPLGVVIPPNIQYLYFAMYLILFLIEGTLDSRSKRIKCFSRLGLWKFMEMLVIVLIISFYFNQKNGSSDQNASMINIILSILLIGFLVCLIVEFVVSLIEMVVSARSNNRVNNQNENEEVDGKKMIELNNTQMTLTNEQKNVFEGTEVTRQNTGQYVSYQYRQGLEGSDSNNKNNKKDEIKIQEIDVQNEQMERVRKESELVVISKVKGNVRKGSFEERDRNNKSRMNEVYDKQNDKQKENSTKGNGSEMDEKVGVGKQINGYEGEQEQDEEGVERGYDDRGDKDYGNANNNGNNGNGNNNNENEENVAKKRQRKQVLNAQLRKIYGIK